MMATSPLYQLEVLVPPESYYLLVFLCLASQQYPPQYLYLMVLLPAMTQTLFILGLRTGLDWL
jgi:hypothetical protein